MKQTNHTPESSGKEMTAEDYFDKWQIENKSVWGDYGDYDSDLYAIAFAKAFAQQQTDKLYTREELKDATDKAFAAGMSRQWASDYGEVPNQYPTHEQWFNQNYPK